MVSDIKIRESNSRISTTLPSNLVAVFVGATAGIGEISIKSFVKHTKGAQIYVLARSQAKFEKLLEECLAINPTANLIFVDGGDLSLLHDVDRACDKIKSEVDAINLLFMTQGTLNFSSKTTEGLKTITGLGYFGRIRFIENLSSQLNAAKSLSRVVNVSTATYEGPATPNDLEMNKGSITKSRGHLATITTFGLEHLAKSMPNVSLIHNFPGVVDTKIGDTLPGVIGFMARGLMKVSKLGGFRVWDKPDDVGERHVFFATSAMYPAAVGDANGVPVETELKAATGSDGKAASGVYSIDQNGEAGGPTVQKLLASMRSDGVDKQAWESTVAVFKKVFGEAPIVAN
jgi:NAD(P)-dependent dehydrogenase (short-subunit alcohol dehydrogenase family)